MDSARWRDAALAGLMQGLSVLPGLSRSGLTVAALLGRGFRPRDALALSFLMSVPAGLGGAVYAAIVSGGAVLAPEPLAGAGMAFVAGFLTVRFLLRLAALVNWGWLLTALGGTLLAGSLWRLPWW